VVTVLSCLIKGEPRKFNKIVSSGILGEGLDEYCEVDADGYKLAFFVRGSSITNPFLLITPANREWEMNHDGGSPMVGFPIEEQRQLTDILLGDYLAKNYHVVPLWMLHRGDKPPSFPSSYKVYNSEKEAQKELVRFKAMVKENDANRQSNFKKEKTKKSKQ